MDHTGCRIICGTGTAGTAVRYIYRAENPRLDTQRKIRQVTTRHKPGGPVTFAWRLVSGRGGRGGNPKQPVVEYCGILPSKKKLESRINQSIELLDKIIPASAGARKFTHLFIFLPSWRGSFLRASCFAGTHAAGLFIEQRTGATRSTCPWQ